LRSIPPGHRVFAYRRPAECFHPAGDLFRSFTPPSASLTFKPRCFSRPRSTPKPGVTAPRLSFTALQHSHVNSPFIALLSKCPEDVALSPRKSRPQGLATLSTVSARSHPEASFSFPRSWASPFEALLLPDDRRNVSVPPLRSRAFLRNLFGLGSALQRVPPIRKAAPLFATERIRFGQGHCFLRVSGLSGFPSGLRIRQVSLPSNNPCGIGSRHLSRSAFASPLGCYRRPARHLPFQGAGLSGLSAVRSRVLFEPSTPADYFFILRIPRLLPAARPLS